MGTAKIELRGIGLAALSFGVFLYFAFHLLQGDRGYFSLQRAEIRLAEVQRHYERSVAEREHIQHKVTQLRPQSLDLDMLDERARVVLGFSHADDFIILEK